MGNEREFGSPRITAPMVVVLIFLTTPRIGARTSVQDGSVLHITHASTYNPDGFPLTIGNDVTIGHQATLHGCTVHDRVLIGMKAMVMDGAVIGEGCLVAAGSLIREGFEAPPHTLVAVNLEYVDPSHPVRDGDEVAFFPPVTGG